MVKLTLASILICVLIAGSSGQWPLGQGFYSGMNQMMSRMNNMAVNMQMMSEQMAMQRQTMIDEDIRRSREGAPFADGGSVFIAANGGLGYAYNSTDGSFTLYSLGPGSPPSGYMYHVTATGGTSFQNW